MLTSAAFQIIELSQEQIHNKLPSTLWKKKSQDGKFYAMYILPTFLLEKNKATL